MIIHKLKPGRLGNQLFQIAATLAHAEKMGVKAQFPTWEYNKYFINGIDDKLDQTFDVRFNGIHHNPHYGFDFNYTPIPEYKNLILHGFYHTEKYFENHKQTIVNAFKPKNEFLQVVREAGKEFLHLQNTVGVHIRRGDYLEKTGAHPLLDIDTYYIQAALKLAETIKVKAPIFIIFSDDIEWCKKEFVKHPHIMFSEGNSDIVDLFLMAQCKHHIIANSSFSWWAAWLAKNMFNNEGTTIAPATWFGPDLSHLQTQDIYLPNWIKI